MDKIVIISGAGLSAPSGISTFRDTNGLWEEYDIEEICTSGCLSWNYEETIHFYNLRRQDIQDKIPNHAHEKITQLKKEFPNHIEVITQNVDNLLERAGCSDTLHLHGFLPEIRCMECNDIVNISYDTQDESNSHCLKCNGQMRPNIVFFGEQAPRYEEMYNILGECGLLVVIGTSGNVLDANYLAQYANISILNNLEANDVITEEVFDQVYYESVDTAIDKIEVDIRNYIENGSI